DGQLAFYDVMDRAGLVFLNIQKGQAAQGAAIGHLAARLGVESAPVENDRGTPAVCSVREDARVERQQQRIVVIESRRRHEARNDTTGFVGLFATGGGVVRDDEVDPAILRPAAFVVLVALGARFAVAARAQAIRLDAMRD